jgi:hypothetical protein
MRPAAEQAQTLTAAALLAEARKEVEDLRAANKKLLAQADADRRRAAAVEAAAEAAVRRAYGFVTRR